MLRQYVLLTNVPATKNCIIKLSQMSSLCEHKNALIYNGQQLIELKHSTMIAYNEEFAKQQYILNSKLNSIIQYTQTFPPASIIERLLIMSVSSSTLMQTFSSESLQQDQTYFCYLYIKQISEAWITVGFIVLGLFLFIKASIQFHRALRNDVLSRIVKTIYIIIFVWCLLFLGKIVFSEIIFWLQYYKGEKDDKIYYQYSKASKFLFLIQFIGVFLLQIAIILLPYNWMTFIVGYFSSLYSDELRQSKMAMNKSKKYLKYQIQCIKILRVYVYARCSMLLLIIPFLVLHEPFLQAILVKIMLGLMLIESFLLLIVLILGYISMRKNQQLAQIINKNQIDTMINQYFIIIASMSIRFVIVALFVYLNFQKLSQNTECYIDVQSNKIALEIVVFVVEGLFTHLLPIYVVLKIYDIEDLDTKLTDSLIIPDAYLATQAGQQNSSISQEKFNIKSIKE